MLKVSIDLFSSIFEIFIHLNCIRTNFGNYPPYLSLRGMRIDEKVFLLILLPLIAHFRQID